MYVFVLHWHCALCVCVCVCVVVRGGYKQPYADSPLLDLKAVRSAEETFISTMIGKYVDRRGTLRTNSHFLFLQSTRRSMSTRYTS
jgi:hypothetical protein